MSLVNTVLQLFCCYYSWCFISLVSVLNLYYYYYYYYLHFSKQEEAFDTQNTNKPVTKGMDYDSNNIPYRRKRVWTTTNSDQQHLQTSGAGQSLCDPLNGSTRSFNYPRQFRTGLWAAGQRDFCRHASTAETRNSLKSGSEETLKIEVF